jgi:hypothetical protein
VVAGRGVRTLRGASGRVSEEQQQKGQWVGRGGGSAAVRCRRTG